MKCPNCGKEAIFVNGKYVCLDCGIEISPEQQAAQNMNEPQVYESALPANGPAPETAEIPEAPVAEEPSPVTTETIPVETPFEPTVAPMTEPQKPVQEYYEETLKQEEAPTATGSGIYDFSNDQAVTAAPSESVTEPTVANLSPSAVANVIPEPTVSEPAASVEATQPALPAEPVSYFTPNSFDINSAPVSSQANPSEIRTEPPLNDTPVALEEPPAIPTVPPQTTFEAPTEIKTLDELLGETPVAAPLSESPVSAYGAPTVEPTPANIEKESTMPSVESVFGNQSPTAPASGLPTAQDFGVAPKPKANARPKWLIPALIAGGALILLVGLSLALIALTNKKTAIKYPLSLDQTAIDTLSTNVTAAMQIQQGTAADFNLKADFTELTVDKNISDQAAIEKQLATPYDLNGTWYTDKDGDISTDVAVGEAADKRTYIRSTSMTYVYSAATQKYTKASGLVLTGVPALFEADEKAAPLYATNIKTATLVGKEQLDGAEYSKYELTLNDEIIKETLEVMGGAFKDAKYESLNSDNLKVYVWIGNDNKLKKTTLEGSLDLETDKMSGTITLTGESAYKYLDVTIESPAAPPGAATNTGAPVSATSKNEEGQTSSIDNNNDVVEARG